MTAPQILTWILGPALGILILLFIFRIILTWYPQVEQNRLPFALVTWPTEPFLAPTRRLIPPLGGVDITPILWVALLSLCRELLLGQQGILRMLM
ncbi:YggT family protein [Synechococcales cyanobacterium C]|uniref:YggT family protein n=1 Tax=Petrachloros mirabilis ULC683 TaxID=2781853 RepID=A0A8K1ZZR5_9CYAN|nr:YggT family protein [Petrachloros mirabilis]NCJ07107.1 YggT family protein [Petrachloros mirabilis ULC683]